jgi:hypothetical protein
LYGWQDVRQVLSELVSGHVLKQLQAQHTTGSHSGMQVKLRC